MTAIEIRDKKLFATKRPVPHPGKGSVLVRVHAAGLNRPDLLQVDGKYPPPPGISDIPGLEIAGTVVKGNKKFKAGQKVCALVAGGGYAEYCVVPAGQCLPLPRGLDFVQGAALPETFFTVWRNLFDIGHLRKGESVLIHGGASGIGTAAIQMARTKDARIFVTAGTDAKCRACTDLGAELAVNYKRKDFVSAILKATDNTGINLIIDMIGGDYLPRNLDALATGGRHVSIAMQHGKKASLDIFKIMSKQLTLTGSTLRAQPVATKTAIARKLHKNIWPLLANGKIKPIIDKTFALKDAQAAHDYLRAGKHIGKVILTIKQ
ncbi:MAG: NAD(P)H-quinone oxidoreductase [Alphaproteobacteria bacterium]|nr:NAD(P)H-quinone oxidoreductase [Alphaproteobacteria bacterium]